jgi:hypothetical protein
MIAKLEAIHAEFERRLRGIASANEVTSLATGDPSEFPALNVLEIGWDPDVTTEPGVTRYTLTMAVEGYVRGSDGGTARQDRNALYLAVVEAIIDEPPLGGLAEELNEGPTRPVTATLSNEERMGFVTQFIVTFPANRASPTT